MGSALALHQVNVYHKNGSWELAATEATQIEECPEQLRDDLVRETDLATAGTLLSQAVTIDYDNVKTSPTTLSAMASVIVPRQLRELGGVYEVHSITVLGVSSVLSEGGFTMRSCSKCKAQVREGLDRCESCVDPGEIEQRWIFQLDMADGSGAVTAMLYHDAAVTLPFFYMSFFDRHVEFTCGP